MADLWLCPLFRLPAGDADRAPAEKRQVAIRSALSGIVERLVQCEWGGTKLYFWDCFRALADASASGQIQGYVPRIYRTHPLAARTGLRELVEGGSLLDSTATLVGTAGTAVKRAKHIRIHSWYAAPQEVIEDARAVFRNAIVLHTPPVWGVGDSLRATEVVAQAEHCLRYLDYQAIEFQLQFFPSDGM
jgi:hypothetical protein